MRERKRPDPLLVVALLLLVCAAVVVVWVGRSPGVVEPPPGPASLPVEAPKPPDPDLESKIDKKPARTRKGRLLKRALKKRAAAEKKIASAAGEAHTVALSGDPALLHALQKRMRGVEAGGHSYAVSLRSQSGRSRSGIYVRCSAAVAELPQKKLVASLSSRADVGGGTTEDIHAASEACAASLADDVAAWVRRH